MTGIEQEKKLAAVEAVTYIRPGMTIGLGTGSTADLMILELGKLIKKGLKITGIPSSENTKRLALKQGIPLTTLKEAQRIDITIDGTDEFDPYLQLIKGGGGALLHEKILAYNSNRVIIICDSQKQVSRLGNFKLPIETIPLATPKIERKLLNMSFQPVLRQKKGSNYITTEGNFILDLDITHITNLTLLEQMLKQIPGIVETGLFLDLADTIIMGKKDHTIIFER